MSNKTEFDRLFINNFIGLKIYRRWRNQEPYSDPTFFSEDDRNNLTNNFSIDLG